MPTNLARHALNERPWIVSLVLIILLSLWLAQGQAQEPTTQASGEAPIPLAKVVFDTFVATPTHKTIELYGRTAPIRQAQLGAEYSGTIRTLVAKKGQFVRKGELIARIDSGDLAIQLKRAQAQLTVRQKEYQAAQSLNKRGLQGEVALATAQAALVEAQANVRNVETALGKTEIVAPFSGILDHRFVELGNFVSVGDPIATLIELDTLLIEADVSERHVQALQLGQKAHVKLINGQQIEGEIRYIGQLSSESTNTFPIEIAIDNRDMSIPAGVSAEVDLPLSDALAIKVTAAMLALDEQGNLGVKTLKNSRVHFVPIQLVKAEQDGVWLSGLGTQADIITLGQGFVRDGDDVIARRQLDDTSLELKSEP
ncbi:efflux RND transporter periplasmic adaptor subunit [Vibrio sp. SM6]|uniref:Efflux RND transporter periplasmic adaptor subunit n=1 Tax=Vibrio agarilyticus TaxID=2726741 RepID=A0A7X8TPW2_9VIBR|nr:efflux RND transporter periplasmic adaptor subunit [Vibrio agarilyticus]NLS12740.1 efflux RND transporter periplasmic adaptor subunit [Vibrio agarilyticus]